MFLPQEDATLCVPGWLSFELKWLPKRSLDPQEVKAVWSIVTDFPSYLNQFSYIDHWRKLVLHLPHGWKFILFLLGVRVLLVWPKCSRMLREAKITAGSLCSVWRGGHYTFLFFDWSNGKCEKGHRKWFSLEGKPGGLIYYQKAWSLLTWNGSA